MQKESKLNSTRRLLALAALCLFAAPARADNLAGHGMKNEPSGEYYDWTKTGRPERPWMHPYHEMIVTKMVLCDRRPDGGVGKIHFTFEQSLEVIRKLDNVTKGLPKIIYLVGWQYSGHDSKYPSWAEVNKHLMRAGDQTAEASLNWLIREARKQCNTYVSLHLNMLDAYEDSPLWDSYIANDIVAKNKDGSIRWGKTWNGMRSAPISYYREWSLGFAQKRIDGLLEMLPELRKSATVHIDAFHAFDPKHPRPSDFLGHSQEKEVETMRKIYRYFRDQGMDVTSEYARQFRPDDFVGLQPFAWIPYKKTEHWHLNDSYPPHLYCGSGLAFAPMLVRAGGDTPELWSKVIETFCLLTVPNYTYNVRVAQDKAPLGRSPLKLPLPDEVFEEVLWRNDRAVAVCCRAYDGPKTWDVPKSWRGAKRADIFVITTEGLRKDRSVNVIQGTITVVVEREKGYLVVPR